LTPTDFWHAYWLGLHNIVATSIESGNWESAHEEERKGGEEEKRRRRRRKRKRKRRERDRRRGEEKRSGVEGRTRR
jgi:hypothetical protein